MTHRYLGTFMGALALAGACAACSTQGAGTDTSGAAPTAPFNPTATSAASSSHERLVEAAEKEGRLNVIGMGWAGLPEMIDEFQSRYNVTVSSAQPGASSMEEIAAAKRYAGTGRAPDVFDLDQSVAVANENLFAPYKVARFEQVPENLRDADGKWASGYGGYMAIGYDTAKVARPDTVKDLLKPGYKVSWNGDPVEGKTPFHGAVMASLGNGGSADSLEPAVGFRTDIRKAGNLAQPGQPASAVLDWEYAIPSRGEDWQAVIPDDAAVGSYYAQAINKDAPHPAAARLWQEFVFSDEGQNILLSGKARPSRLESMRKAETLDTDALAELPEVEGNPIFMSADQIDEGREDLAETKSWQ